MGLDQIKLWHFFQINLVTLQFLALLTDSSPALHTSQDTVPIFFRNYCILDSTSFLNSSLKNPSHEMGQRRAEAQNLKNETSCLLSMFSSPCKRTCSCNVLHISCKTAINAYTFWHRVRHANWLLYYHCRMVTSYSSSTISLPPSSALV